MNMSSSMMTQDKRENCRAERKKNIRKTWNKKNECNVTHDSIPYYTKVYRLVVAVVLNLVYSNRYISLYTQVLYTYPYKILSLLKLSMNFIVVVYAVAEDIVHVLFFCVCFFLYLSIHFFCHLFRDFDTFLFYCVKFNKFQLNVMPFVFPISILVLFFSFRVYSFQLQIDKM